MFVWTFIVLLIQSINFQICAIIRHEKNGLRDGGRIRVDLFLLLEGTFHMGFLWNEGLWYYFK